MGIDREIGRHLDKLWYKNVEIHGKSEMAWHDLQLSGGKEMWFENDSGKIETYKLNGLLMWER